MRGLIKKISMTVISAIWLMPAVAHARVVDEMTVKPVSDGYEITVKFLTVVQYQSISPNRAADQFFVQLRAINFASLDPAVVDSLRERVSLAWDTDSDIPLREVLYEGGDPERPQLSFLFTREVEVTAESSADLRDLIVHVKTYHTQPQIAETPETAKVEGPEISGAEPVATQDMSLSGYFDEARTAMAAGDYPRAIQLYTKILETAQGPDKQQSQEYLGVARERNKQLAQAAAEYRKYLKEYPSGPSADRVRQRLSGLMTATAEPKAPLREAKREAPPTGIDWNFQHFGNFSQFYSRDQTTPEGSDEGRVNQSDLASNLDLNLKARSKPLDAGFRFTGGDLRNFIDEEPSFETLSALNFDLKSKTHGLYGRVGRQSLTSGGVLGRFDGLHISSQLNPKLKLNGVTGYPVDSSRQTSVETERRFFGVNVDVTNLVKAWNFNTYLIHQENSGFTDRFAAGGEARYFDENKALFGLLDYDLHFNTVNMFLVNGHWTLPSKTTFNAVIDYRKTPLLTTNNAIIGQGVTHLTDITGRFSEDEIKELADNRTTNSKSATFGVTQDLNEKIQAIAEFSASQIEGTIASGGVEGTLQERPDYTYSLQLVANDIWLPNDSFITGLSLTNTHADYTYSLNLNSRIPVTQKARLNPRFRMDYRKPRLTEGRRVTVRPSVRLEYNVSNSVSLEVEGGVEWLDDKSALAPLKSTESFVTVGYRFTF